MALPTDPTKLAAYRARQARNAANYRARQKTARLGGQVLGVSQGIVERAAATARSRRARQAAVINNLPDYRNPKVALRYGEITERARPERKTDKGRQLQARRIREQSEAQKLQSIGRARKEQLRNELKYGSMSDRYAENMDARQQALFQKYSERIASVSQQTLAIIFHHTAGGQGQYSAALERILASPQSRDVEEGLGMLAALAQLAERADSMYSPRVIGRLSV